MYKHSLHKETDSTQGNSDRAGKQAKDVNTKKALQTATDSADMEELCRLEKALYMQMGTNP